MSYLTVSSTLRIEFCFTLFSQMEKLRHREVNFSRSHSTSSREIAEAQSFNFGHLPVSYYIHCQLGIWSVRSLPLNIWRAAKQKRMRSALCGFKGTETTLCICIIHSHNSHILSSNSPKWLPLRHRNLWLGEENCLAQSTCWFKSSRGRLQPWFPLLGVLARSIRLNYL